MADQADIASLVEDLERQWALQAHQRRRVRVCTVCGEEIEAQRLALLPDTDVCGACAGRAADGG